MLGINLIPSIFSGGSVLVSTIAVDLFFCLIAFSNQKFLSFRCQVAPAKLVVSDPDQRLLTARKLQFPDLIFDEGVFPQNCVTVMSVQNVTVPHNDRINKSSVSENVQFKLLEFIETER